MNFRLIKGRFLCQGKPVNARQLEALAREYRKELSDYVKPTLDRIAQGKRFPHIGDGTVFRNEQRLLPMKPEGYYREYVHAPVGQKSPRGERVILGEGGEVYYSPDHYTSFIQIQ
jgi:guanyl-specific ribonuclease Sa